METVIRYQGENLLAYAAYGDPAGCPVLVQHGMIASIRDGHLFRRLTQAGARVIALARPGYGASSPYEMADIAEWGEIAAVLVRALGLGPFDVLGISSGAPYSYAIAHVLPDLVRRVFILSGTPALYDERIAAHWPYPIQRDAALPELQALARALFFSGLSEADRARDDVRDSMRHDCFGIAQDLRLRCADWGFRLADVRAPVVMQHSRGDEQVPLITAEMTARLLPDCRLEVREGGAHFSGQVLDEFLSHNQDLFLGPGK